MYNTAQAVVSHGTSQTAPESKRTAFWQDFHCNRQNQEHHEYSSVILRPWNGAAQIFLFVWLKMKCHQVPN